MKTQMDFNRETGIASYQVDGVQVSEAQYRVATTALEDLAGITAWRKRQQELAQLEALRLCCQGIRAELSSDGIRYLIDGDEVTRSAWEQARKVGLAPSGASR